MKIQIFKSIYNIYHINENMNLNLLFEYLYPFIKQCSGLEIKKKIKMTKKSSLQGVM